MMVAWNWYALIGKPAGVSRLEPYDIPGLRTFGDSERGVGGGHEFRAGLLQPGIQGQVVIREIRSAENDILDTLADLLRWIIQEKNFHALFSVRTPERDVNVVCRSDETYGFDVRRQQRTDAG